jgi:signal transduction histidine kinase
VGVTDGPHVSSRWERGVGRRLSRVFTRAQLGAGYLVVSALGLLIGLLLYLVFTFESTLVLAIGVLAGALPFLVICALGVTALRTELPEDFAWRIATWFALGLSLSTLAGVTLGLGWASVQRRELGEFLVVTIIGSGSIIGALVGTVLALRDHHRELRIAHKRNSVMNRVLRHNIRNDINVIQAHVDLLEDEVESAQPHTAVIDRKSRDILSLSAAARDLDGLANGGTPDAVDLATLVEDYVDHANDRFPDATVTAAVPDTCEVDAAPQVRSVIDNLVENAVQHNDRDEPTVGVELEYREGDVVELRVRDDGPGIPRDQFEVLFADGEAHDNHGSGLGLWLVKWFAERHDGDIRLDGNDPRGSVVCLELPVRTDPVR